MDDRLNNPLPQAFFTHSKDAIEITNQDAKITYVNPAFERDSGYSAHDVIGRISLELFQMDAVGSPSETYEEIYRIISTKGVWEGEITTRKKDGSPWVCLTTILQVNDNAGNLLHYISTRHDISAQKQVETELRKTQNRLNCFEKIGSDWFWEMDADLRYSYFSPSMHDKTGLNVHDFIGKTNQEIDPTRLQSAVWRKHMDDLENHRPFHNFSYPITTADNRRIYESLSGNPVFDDEGHFTGYIGVGTNINITRIKKTETELSQQNARFSNAIAQISQGISVFDENQRLILSNDNYATLYGLAPDAIKPGMSLNQILEIRLQFGNHIGSKAGEYYDLLIERANAKSDSTATYQLNDGRYIEVRYHGIPEGGWVATHEDVTEQIHAKRALLDSQEMLSKAFQANPIPVVISDVVSGEFLNVNEAWIKTLGHSFEDVVGKAVFDLNLWVDLEQRNALFAKLKADGFVDELEVKLRTKDNREIDCLISVQHIDIGGDRRLIILTQDVTERREAELELRKHRDHLQELIDAATVELQQKANELTASLEAEKEMSAMQRQFVTMASHEFRTPLAIIDGTAQRLKNRIAKNQTTAEDSIERLDKIRAAVVRMTKLMESTLSAAQMEQGKFTLNIQPCQIAKIISSTCERQQDIAINHLITCTMNDLPQTIMADPGSLEQMLTNLLSNAVKYSPEAPNIYVQAWRQGDTFFMSVRDEGLGINKDDLPRMFERFFRAQSSIGIAGTGIGLNLASALIKMHGGTLTVESEINKGSIFTIRLPIAGPANNTLSQAQVA